MPVTDALTELISALARFLGRFFGEFLLDIAVKGLGYRLGRPLFPSLDPDGIPALLLGVAAWGVLIAAALGGWAWWQAAGG